MGLSTYHHESRRRVVWTSTGTREWCTRGDGPLLPLAVLPVSIEPTEDGTGTCVISTEVQGPRYRVLDNSGSRVGPEFERTRHGDSEHGVRRPVRGETRSQRRTRVTPIRGTCRSSKVRIKVLGLGGRNGEGPGLRVLVSGDSPAVRSRNRGPRPVCVEAGGPRLGT